MDLSNHEFKPINHTPFFTEWLKNQVQKHISDILEHFQQAMADSMLTTTQANSETVQLHDRQGSGISLFTSLQPTAMPETQRMPDTQEVQLDRPKEDSDIYAGLRVGAARLSGGAEDSGTAEGSAVPGVPADAASELVDQLRDLLQRYRENHVGEGEIANTVAQLGRDTLPQQSQVASSDPRAALLQAALDNNGKFQLATTQSAECGKRN